MVTDSQFCLSSFSCVASAIYWWWVLASTFPRVPRPVQGEICSFQVRCEGCAALHCWLWCLHSVRGTMACKSCWVTSSITAAFPLGTVSWVCVTHSFRLQSSPSPAWPGNTSRDTQLNPGCPLFHFSKKMLNFLSWKVKGKKHAILLEASLLEALFLCSKGSINLDIFISTKYVTLLSRNKSNHPALHIQCLCY